MSEDVLLALAVAATTGAAIILFTVARRSAPAAAGTVVPLTGQPVGERPSGSAEHLSLTDPTAWQSATVTELSVAEKLLDWAEAEGYQERELAVLDESTFHVRWRNRG